MSQNPPEVLGYNSDVKGLQLCGRWAVWGFVIGLFLGFLVILSVSLANPNRTELKVKLALAALDLISLLPVAMAGLWAVIWWRLRSNPYQTYRSFPMSLVCGAAVIVIPRFLIFHGYVTIGIVAVLAAISARLLCISCDRHDVVTITYRQSRQRALVWLLIVAVSIGGGMLMALFGGEACEEYVARQQLPRRPLHLRNNADNETQQIYGRIGITMLPAGTDQSDRFPWAQVGRAKLDSPFVVRIKYGWVWESTYGGGGEKRLLYLFGLVLELEDQASWAT